MVITAINNLRNLIIPLWTYSLVWGYAYPVFLNYTYYDNTSREHIFHTVHFNRNDLLCFIVAAYFPLQVLILAFVKVTTLPLKMLYKVCGKILCSCWSQGEQSHLLCQWEVLVLGCYTTMRIKMCLPNARWSFPVEPGGVLSGLWK